MTDSSEKLSRGDEELIRTRLTVANDAKFRKWAQELDVDVTWLVNLCLSNISNVEIHSLIKIAQLEEEKEPRKVRIVRKHSNWATGFMR